MAQTVWWMPAAATLFLAYFSPYLTSRFQTLSLMIKNKPEKLQEINALPNYSIKFADRIRNCEDGLVVEENGIAILSCDPGRDWWNTVMGTFHPNRSEIPNGELLIYRYDLPESSEKVLAPIKLVDYPAGSSFHPLGIEYHVPSSRLFVCNHHIEGSRVEVFSLDLSLEQPVAKHIRTIISPLLNSPNAVTALSKDEIYVTNDHRFLRKDHPWLSLLETYAGYPGGNLAYVNLATEEAEIKILTHIPFANGVTLLNESAVVAVASTSSARVNLYKIQANRSVQLSEVIHLSFMPDNLSTDKDGVLLIAGHPHPPSLEKSIIHRRACSKKSEEEQRECWKANAPSWAVEWTKEGGLRDLYVSKREFGSSSTVMRDSTRKVGIITGLYEQGILVWRE